MGTKKTHRRSSFADDRMYLTKTTRINVRFQEVDSMHIVWHGHYISYFEEARRGFGRRYGIDYPAFLENDIGAPVIQVWVDYISPALFTDQLDVVARLYKSDGAKIEFGYEVRREETQELLASGGSVQVFTTLDGELLLTPPALMDERYNAWKDAWIAPA